MSARAAIVLTALLAAVVSPAGELEALREAIEREPGSLEARRKLAAACQEAGDRLGAQRAWWAAWLLAEDAAAARSRARAALVALDRHWQAVFDRAAERQGDWAKLAERLANKGDPDLDRMVALCRRRAPVVDEPWCSPRGPLDAFRKLTLAWKGTKVLGKGGVSVLEVPQKEAKGLAGQTIVVEALELTVEGRTHSKEPELEVTAQVGTGTLTWGKATEAPKAPVWVRARRLGSRDDAMQPIRFWLRYYPPKGIGVGTPLCDPRMLGRGKAFEVRDALAAALRLESLLPRNKIEITRITLTLYVREHAP